MTKAKNTRKALVFSAVRAALPVAAHWGRLRLVYGHRQHSGKQDQAGNLDVALR